MDPHLVWHDLAPDYAVLELQQTNAGATAFLELHVVTDLVAGGIAAWWEDDRGRWICVADIGTA